VFKRACCLFPTISQINPVHALSLCFNIIFPSAIVFWVFFVRHVIICSCVLPQTCYMPSPAQPPSFNHSNSVCWEVQVVGFSALALSVPN
jgi:hypothetical protein